MPATSSAYGSQPEAVAKTVTQRPSSSTTARVKGGTYTDAEIERGLHAMALCSGNGRRAHELLKQDGFKVGERTLYTWKHRHAERYRTIQDEVLPKVYAGLAAQNEALAQRALDVERQLIDRVEDEAANIKPGDLAGAARNLSVVKGVAMDKAAVIRGRPTEIREERTMVEVARSLERYAGVIKVNIDAIDSTAEEIDPPLPKQ